jgi:hypothetical protein
MKSSAYAHDAGLGPVAMMHPFSSVGAAPVTRTGDD